MWASVVLHLMGFFALWCVGSSQTRDQARVPCTGRWTQPLGHLGGPMLKFF